MAGPGGPRIDAIDAAAFRIPTETAESDGTFQWDSTTLVVVHASSGRVRGMGYTYGAAEIVPLISSTLARCATGQPAMATEAAWNAMCAAVRNIGRPGLAAGAIAAIDAALWDLKARLLHLPLVTLIGQVRDAVPVYGSGGFTNYSDAQLQQQFSAWAELGIRRFKMKVGRRSDDDERRVAWARTAIGPDAALMVDANGGYRTAEAVRMARQFSAFGVDWFEEPVSSDHVSELGHVRAHAPPGMAIAAGEYGYDAFYFRRLLETGAVDVLQADATRCLGVTGFLAAGRLAAAWGVPLSAHTAPSLHLHLGCAVTPVVHLEYFHDHARIEALLFEGFVAPKDGMTRPDPGRAGIGIELKRQDADRFAVA
jgi:L-alanine-DL-glutamate epimerase-like enolase superfamily enzyme